MKRKRKYLITPYIKSCLNMALLASRKVSRNVESHGFAMNGSILCQLYIWIGISAKLFLASRYALFWMMLQERSCQEESLVMQLLKTLFCC